MRIILVMAVAMLGLSHQAFAQAPAREVVVVDGQIAVTNLPESQTVNGTVSVDNLPDVQDVWLQGATNPIPILDVTPNTSIAPSDIFKLGTSIIAPGDTLDMTISSPEAVNQGVFTVPDGKFFVVTSVTIFPTSLGTDSVGVIFIQSGPLPPNDRGRDFWLVPTSQPTTLTFGPGMLIAAGYSLKARNFSGGASIRIGLYGYLIDQ